MMRYGMLIAGALMIAAPAQAKDPQSVYVTLMLQAFAAKVECPNTDVVYQDLLQKAQQMQLPEGTTETTIVQVLQPGFVVGERVVRAARVAVADAAYLSARDFVAVQGIVAMIAIIVAVTNFAVDIIAAFMEA